MTYLTHNGAVRAETAAEIIANLKRKGWVEVTPPSYDLATQRIEWNSTTGIFDVIDIPQCEINQQKLSQAVEQGYPVQPENITLGLNDSDRTLFTQMLSLVKEALELGLITNDTEQIIADQQGNKHTVTTLRFRQIMVEYGFFYKNLWNIYS